MTIHPAGNRTISSAEFDSLQEFLQEYEIPSYSLVQRAQHGSGFNSFEITDDERRLTVLLAPKTMASTVNSNAPQKEPADAYIVEQYGGNQNAWFVPAEAVDACEQLPEVRQAFHEGESYQDREADYKYHFDDGETMIAAPSSDPIPRLEEPVTITAIESLGGTFPQKWLLETEGGEYWYLRERSGSIRLFDQPKRVSGEEVFQAYIGREHPGTWLHGHEVLNIISAVDYINIVDNPDNEVSEEAKDAYWGDWRDSLSDEPLDDEVVDELFDTGGDDE